LFLPKTLPISISRFRALSTPFRPLSASMSSIKAEVEEHIKQNKVMVFSKSYCPYCTEAKNAISKLGVPFKAVELDVRTH
jgi:thioredoxin-related protein